MTRRMVYLGSKTVKRFVLGHGGQEICCPQVEIRHDKGITQAENPWEEGEDNTTRGEVKGNFSL